MIRTAFIAAAIACLASAALAQTAPHATPPDPFKYLSAKDVNALTDKPGAGAHTAFVGDHENSFVEYANRSEKGNEPEVHAHWTHYIHVLGGEATLTYGGTVTKPRENSPGQIRGEAITGGQDIAVHEGDYIQIPAGMPHLFTIATGHKLRYLVFNVRQ